MYVRVCVRARVDGRARTPAQARIISAHAPVDCRVGGKADIAGGVSKPFRPCREFSTAWFLVAVGGRSCLSLSLSRARRPGRLRITSGCRRAAEIIPSGQPTRVLFDGKLVYRAREAAEPWLSLGAVAQSDRASGIRCGEKESVLTLATVGPPARTG